MALGQKIAVCWWVKQGIYNLEKYIASFFTMGEFHPVNV